MKIVLICNEYPPRPHGGIGTFVQSIAHGLFRRGHKMTVVGLGEEEGENSDQGIRVVTLKRYNLRYVGNLISRLRLRRWLSACVNAGEVDIIEAPEYMGLLPFGVDSCPVVIRLHLSDTAIRISAGQRRSRGIFFYEQRTLIANRNWIGVSHYILELTKSTFGVSPKRSTIVYNPVAPTPCHLPEIARLPANYVLYASAVSRRKGALVLAEAARELLARRADLHLLYVGGISKEGGRPISEHILQLIGPILAERVHFFGHRDRKEVLAYMNSARVFAFPSNLEAFGLVVLEAMNCGVPVVCTNIPPGPEIIEDGVTGLLADPTSPKDFTEKIARILCDPALASRLVANAQRSISQRFSLEKCLMDTENFYTKCLTK